MVGLKCGLELTLTFYLNISTLLYKIDTSYNTIKTSTIPTPQKGSILGEFDDGNLLSSRFSIINKNTLEHISIDGDIESLNLNNKYVSNLNVIYATPSPNNSDVYKIYYNKIKR